MNMRDMELSTIIDLSSDEQRLEMKSICDNINKIREVLHIENEKLTEMLSTITFQRGDIFKDKGGEFRTIIDIDYNDNSLVYATGVANGIAIRKCTIDKLTKNIHLFIGTVDITVLELLWCTYGSNKIGDSLL